MDQKFDTIVIGFGKAGKTLDGGKLEAVFAKHSWNMIRLAK